MDSLADEFWITVAGAGVGAMVGAVVGGFVAYRAGKALAKDARAEALRDEEKHRSEREEHEAKRRTRDAAQALLVPLFDLSHEVGPVLSLAEAQDAEVRGHAMRQAIGTISNCQVTLLPLIDNAALDSAFSALFQLTINVSNPASRGPNEGRSVVDYFRFLAYVQACAGKLARGATLTEVARPPDFNRAAFLPHWTAPDTSKKAPRPRS